MSKTIQSGKNIDIEIETEYANSILYFLIDSKGNIQKGEKVHVNEDKITLKVASSVTKNLQIGSNNIKIFAISDQVLKPDFYETSFLVTEKDSKLPSTITNFSNIEPGTNYNIFAIPIILIVLIIIVAVYVKTKFQSKP